MIQLLDRSRFEVKLGSYAVGPSTAVNDAAALIAAQDYRRRAAARMMPIGKSDVRSNLPKAEYLASRKIDGEFTVLNFADGDAFSINPGGTVRIGLPWLEEAAKVLQNAGIKTARIAGEMYWKHPNRRPRVHDVIKVLRGPQSQAELERLAFAPFDIIEIDGGPASENYASSFQTLESIFAESRLNTPVESRVVDDLDDVLNLFQQWVEQDGAEGLVLRSDSAGSFKLKPLHTIDAVIVGFTESTEQRSGLLHDVLVAVMRNDGALHVLTRVGGGFSEELRRAMLSDLKDMVVESEYVEVNSDYVAYQMVRPEWVIEFSCLDLVAETTRGGHVNRMVILYDERLSKYEVVRRMPLASVISPQFIRRREDKQPQPDHIPLRQISDIVDVAMADADAKSFSLPSAEILKREVFTKVLKGETMVRKFILIKTNKDQAADDFPAFVLHYTDFSPNRKEPLQREVMVSSSEEQIQALYLSMRQEYVKKGWNPT